MCHCAISILILILMYFFAAAVSKCVHLFKYYFSANFLKLTTLKYRLKVTEKKAEVMMLTDVPNPSLVKVNVEDLSTT